MAAKLKPSIFVVFGITGDLSKRKLLPALYHLIKDELLNEKTKIVGISRRVYNTDDLLNQVELCVLEKDEICDPKVIEKMRNKMQMFQMDVVNDEDYLKLKQRLDDIENDQGVCMNRLFYLSIPPQVYGPITRKLGQHKLQTGCQHGEGVSRLLVEKPFGYDLISAKDLIKKTAQYFNEEQIYRIDHFLAKETAQNILVFRQANPVFDDDWNNKHVAKIDILASESLDVEGRGGFYDQIGALRDIVQSHLMQLLTLVTMELPGEIDEQPNIHKYREKLLGEISPYDSEHKIYSIRGQYKGYPEEISNPGSNTETYVSLKLFINNDVWQNVPITLTTGKAMKAKKTEISLTFKHPDESAANVLTFRIQPNEGIDLKLNVKTPGFESKLQPAAMDFSYMSTFNTQASHPDAYERVLVDAVRGDKTLFATSDEILESWRVLQPILDDWERNSAGLITYDKGSESVS